MKYFTIEELCKSDTAIRKGIDNTPNSAVQGNLEALVDNILDPLRKALGKPIFVSSGYRCEKLNKAVGGAKNSNHLFGYAADIYVKGGGVENLRLFNYIREHFDFDELFNEKPNGQGYPSWVHVAWRGSGKNRHKSGVIR